MIAVGARVRLRGLQAKPELNGREGLSKLWKSETGRWTVAFDDGSEFAFKAANIELAHGPPPAALPNVAEGVDRLLAQLENTRGSVCDAMVYCMEHADQHAPTIAQRLLGQLGRQAVGTDHALPRLYVVSDVFYNCRRDGSYFFNSAPSPQQQLGLAMQDQLPEAFERLGRIWLRKISDAERARASNGVKSVLQAWKDWNLFPALFSKGLESLLFAQVFEISAKEADKDPDNLLRPKLARWFAGLNQGQLPQMCQQRGLAGKQLVMTSCRARLCHFERYWHLRPGATVRFHSLQSAAHLNDTLGNCEEWDFLAGRWKVRIASGEVKSLKSENLILVSQGVEQGISSKKRFGSVDHLDGERKRFREVDPMDGEMLTTEDFQAIAVAEAERLSVARSVWQAAVPPAPPKPSYGVWTEVNEDCNRRLVAPADFVDVEARGAWHGGGTESVTPSPWRAVAS